MKVTEIDHRVFLQLARDTLRAHQRVTSSGAQEALQGALIELGLLPETLTSGEATVVFGVLGILCGALLDNKADIATTQAIMMGDRSRIGQTRAGPACIEQLSSFLVFMDAQLQKICKPGTDQAVLAALVAVFCKTVDGMAAASPS